MASGRSEIPMIKTDESRLKSPTMDLLDEYLKTAEACGITSNYLNTPKPNADIFGKEKKKRTLKKMARKSGKKSETSKMPKNPLEIAKRKARETKKEISKMKAKSKSPVEEKPTIRSSISKMAVDAEILQLTKKLKDETSLNEKLKLNTVNLTKENDDVKAELNLRELEIEKVVQYWTITKHQLTEEQVRSIELETKLQQVKTDYMEEVSLLNKKICMLEFDAVVNRVNSTQTDLFGKDSDCSGFANSAAQTIQIFEDWNESRAHDALRSNDIQMSELIAEIENSRLQAQTDFKFAVVQMEQKLRHEHEAELRVVKEDKENQLEEIARQHNDKLLFLQHEMEQMKSELTIQLTEQSVEIAKLNDSLTDAQVKNQTQITDYELATSQLGKLKLEYEHLNREFKKSKVEGKEFSKNLKTIDALKNRLEKIEEINEILLAEFKKVEQEKNLYAEKLHPSRALSNAYYPKAENRAMAFQHQLDEIRRTFGGLHIT